MQPGIWQKSLVLRLALLTCWGFYSSHKQKLSLKELYDSLKSGGGGGTKRVKYSLPEGSELPPAGADSQDKGGSWASLVGDPEQEVWDPLGCRKGGRWVRGISPPTRRGKPNRAPGMLQRKDGALVFPSPEQHPTAPQPDRGISLAGAAKH